MLLMVVFSTAFLSGQGIEGSGNVAIKPWLAEFREVVGKKKLRDSFSIVITSFVVLVSPAEHGLHLQV